MLNNLYKIAFDSISAHIAVLDAKGVILATNRAWQEFAGSNGLSGPIDCVGINYLAVCDHAARHKDRTAKDIAAGIRRVIAAQDNEFFTRYPCHSPAEQRWYAMRVVPFRSGKKRQVLVSHENITPIMQAHDALEKKERELQQQSIQLQESNVALKVLLEHRENDRQKLEETVLVNVKELVFPYIDKLLRADLPARERTLVEIVQERLNDIISPFMGRLAALNKQLTPQEIQVAGLVREGKTSKEIADVMLLSVAAVNFHRKNIRKKLGLSRSGANLRSHLLSLQ